MTEIIRVMNASDTIDLSNIIYSNFEYLEGVESSKHCVSQISRLIKNIDTVIYYAVNNNKLIGYIVGTKNIKGGKKFMYVSYVYVLEMYRGGRIGKKLFDEMEKCCMVDNINMIVLTYNEYDVKVAKFYTNMGYIKASHDLHQHHPGFETICKEF